MPKNSWWLFLLIFGLLIGGIQSLGWWTRHSTARAEATQPTTPANGKPCQACEVKHWRSIVMQP